MTPEELVTYITQPAVADALWQALVVPHLTKVKEIIDFSIGVILGIAAGLSFVRGFMDV